MVFFARDSHRISSQKHPSHMVLLLFLSVSELRLQMLVTPTCPFPMKISSDKKERAYVEPFVTAPGYRLSTLQH